MSIGWSSVRKLPWYLLLILLVSTPSFLTAQSPLDFKSDELVKEVSQLVKQHFYDASFDTTAWNEKVDRTLEQMNSSNSLDEVAHELNLLLSTLNASHTYFFSRNNPKRYQLLGVFHALYDQDDSSLFVYEGIGFETKHIDGKDFVIAVYDGLPAHRAGIRYGDQVVSVDGHSFHPFHSFKGKANQNVEMELISNGKGMSVSASVEKLDGRNMFETALESSIQTFERNGKDIGYIHIWSYAGVKYQEALRSAILWGDLSQCDALIIDLRNGWGGADLNYLNLLRTPIATVQSTAKDGQMGSYSGVWERPVALLINEYSTSGKELFAYGFKKLALGQVIGEKSAGAVVAGRIFKLSSGDVLYLAVRDVTVDGVRIEGNGISPDILVPRPFLSNKDPQLEKALDHLGNEEN